MSKDHTKLEVINESPRESTKNSRPLDLNALEMVFGTPNSPKTDNKPDVHLIKNEKDHGKDTHVNNDALSEPLLEPEKDRPKPPLAGPEIDDLDDEVNKSTAVIPYPGIDDGLLDIDDDGEKKPNGEHDPNFEKDGSHHKEGDDASTDDGKWPLSHGDDEADYPLYDANGLSPRFGIDDRPGSPMLPPGSIPDVNTYQQKKNLAQGMMDLALLSANANQLRYVLESSGAHPYYYPSLSLIAISIIIQIAVGVGLIMNSRYNVKDEKDICKADKINNMTVLGIFLITIVNVFITSFSVATPTTTVGGSVLQTPIQRTAT